MPTQLKGRRIVYGRPYCSCAPRAKYSVGADTLVLREQVVGELVEVGDAADHRRARHDVVAIRREPGQEGRVFRVAFDQVVPRLAVERPLDGSVLAVVVHADDLVAGVQ
jgi:hypothetical protein